MRLIAWSLLALTSCASAVAPASRPAPASAPAPFVPDGMVLDAQGIREMLAGVELELGDGRAQVAAAEQRAVTAEEHRLLAGFIGLAVGAIIAGVLAAFGGK